MVSRSLEQVVKNTKSFAGNPEVNDMFWALHPGGAAILRQIETQLKLSPLKLKVCLQYMPGYKLSINPCNKNHHLFSVICILLKLRSDHQNM